MSLILHFVQYATACENRAVEALLRLPTVKDGWEAEEHTE